MKSMLSCAALVVLIGCEGIGVGASVDVERIPASETRTGIYMYSAKFLCGSIHADASNLEFPSAQLTGVSLEVMTPGTYLTAVNIHNPHNDRVQVAKKAVQAIPERDYAKLRGEIQPSPILEEVLDPDGAMEVDCVDILMLFGQGSPGDSLAPYLARLQRDFTKGFVVLQSELPLDVVGVYSYKNVEGNTR